ncbi:amino acid ABC transporter permease [Candidatus Dependentiae bacterium]|nr:amino acid ABC transporter permease [Candidatus Dependentiae bacterium]
MNNVFSQFLVTLTKVASGIPTTLVYSFLPLLFGFTFGIFLAFAKISGPRPLRWFVNFYVSVFRGTPLLVQLFLVAYGLPFKLSPFTTGIIAFSLNSSAYVCEIIRAGIEGVSKGQYEAMQALSIPYWIGMKDIILPQALKTVLPALVSESINLVKESAIISQLPSITDITRCAHLVNTETYAFFEPMLAAACCYYIITSILNFIGYKLEMYLQTENDHD